MSDSPYQKAMSMSPYTILKEALQELKQQLIYLESSVVSSQYPIQLLVSVFKEQTNDFLHYIEPVNHIEQQAQANSETSEEVTIASTNHEINKVKTKTPFQNIVIKVSNNHYVPKVLHPQTIVTYKTE